jgi:hypothetical protein
MQDLTDRNAVDFLAAKSFMNAKAIFVDRAVIFMGFILTQMLTGVTVKGATASATPTALSFPAF